MYERILRTDVIGRPYDPIRPEDWNRAFFRGKVAQEALDIEAALAVPINELSNETNGPQDYEGPITYWFGETRMTGYSLRQFWV